MSVCDTCGGRGLLSIAGGKLACPDCHPDPRARAALGGARRAFAAVEKTTDSSKPKT